MKTTLLLGIVSALLCSGLHAAEEGLLAHYDFEAGSGSVARDVTGGGHDGQLQGGAAWEKGDFGTALRLNGTDAFVDCGRAIGAKLAAQGTLVVWVRPEVAQGGLVNWSTGGGWNDERLTLSLNTYHGAPRLLWVMADGKGFGSRELAPLPVGVWTQLALTYDGAHVSCYRNGVRAETTGQLIKPLLDNVPLWLGKCLGLGQDYFKGLMDEVRLYDRPLDEVGVLALYKAEAGRRGHDTKAFTQPAVVVTPDALTGRLSVGINYACMRPLPAKTSGVVTVFPAKGGKPLAETRLPLPASRSEVRAYLPLGKTPPQQLRVVTAVSTDGGKAVGPSVTTTVSWPKRDPRFSPERGVKILNNMCFELLNVAQPGPKSYTVHNPREGWLFFQLKPTAYNFGTVIPAVELDGKTVPLRLVNDRWEAMRYVPAGPHQVQVKVGRGEWVQNLVVRSVGELVYAMYGANPLVPETGNYSWEWLRKHCLDHYNTVIGPASVDFAPAEKREWVGEGKQWMTQRNLPFDMNVDQVYEYWTKEAGFADPVMSGIWADEFYGGEAMQKMYPIWCEALRRIKANPQYAGKRFYAFTGATYIADYDLLAKTLVACDYRIGAEWYLKEVPGEVDLEPNFGPEWEANSRAAWENAAPGAAMSRLWVLGLLSQPEESCDIHPQCDYNAFLDLQFEFLANDPAFFGLRGLYGYYSPYVGEEQTRLFAALVRHYALEGRTDRFLKDPYMLPHVQNPDFTAGLQGWQVAAAAEGAVEALTVDSFGWLQGRYTSKVGDTAVRTRRSAERPNVLAQELKGLQPGRLYSLRFFTGNYQDYLAGKSNAYRHAMQAQLEGVQVLPEKCFQAVIKSNYAHTYGKFNRDNPYRMNYHQIVFRAQGPTAKLSFRDWKSPTEPGGPAGEELIWNFIQVQPFFPE